MAGVLRFVLLGFVLLLTAIGVVRAVEPAEAKVDFNRDIRPLLSDRCLHCHGLDKKQRKGRLRLDQREFALEEADSGFAAIVPGDADESELMLRLLETDETMRMPPKSYGKERFTPEQVALFARWINQGAEYEPHWAFKPLARPEPPKLKDANYSEHPIDRIVLARLEQQGIAPSPEADRVTLIRRLAFDLTGLPPTQEEVRQFVDDSREDAYPRLADRLLASSHYGERMAIFWLDLVRYADTVGFHGDQPITYWPYRDYVIDAFNANLPFDQFTREQLAGDLLPNATLRQKIAASYNRLGMMTAEGGAQPKEYLAIYAADRVRNLSGAWLGATVQCAQCHDHKFDPFTASDFYSISAFFADVKERGFYGGAHSNGQWGEMMPVPSAEQDKQLQQLAEKVAGLEKQEAEPSSELDAARKELAELQKTLVKMPATVAVTPREIRLLPRGNWMDESGPVMQPSVPAFLAKLDTEQRRATRLDLADWVTAADNPLTSRTLVNRIWKLFFGQGICRSPDNLGTQGELPSHPELIDHLALDLIASGWDMKQLVRSIVLSRTYRQSSQPRPELAEVDPENRLLARQSRYRLDAELVRDNALATSGLLTSTVGGPSVKPYQPAGYYAQLNFPTRTYRADRGEKQYRRGLYSHWQRTFLHPMLRAFDAPTREQGSAQRTRSNTPLQALVLLNDPSFVEAARALAERIVREGGDDDAARIDWAYRQVVSRDPQSEVAAILAEIRQKHLAHFQADPEAAKELAQIGDRAAPGDIEPAELAAWTSVARVLLNMHETITRY